MYQRIDVPVDGSATGVGVRILDPALAMAQAAGVEADIHLRDAFPGSVQEKVAARSARLGPGSLPT